MNRKMLAASIAFMLFLGSVSAVYAIYTMQSNHLPHTSTAQALIVLSQNATTSIVGDTLTLTATETSLTGTTVTFYDGAAVIGNIVSSAGSAVLNYPIATAKVFDFHAAATHP
jgi:hypothetical protein